MRRIIGVAAIALLTGGIVLVPAGDSEPLPVEPTEDEVRKAGQKDFLERIRFAPIRRTVLDGPSDEEAIRIAMERGAELRRNREAGKLVPVAVDGRGTAAVVADPAPAASSSALRSGWQVTGTSVNLRAGPGTNHAVVGQAGLGERMEPQTDTNAEWIRVRRADGQEAWIFARFLGPANG